MTPRDTQNGTHLIGMKSAYLRTNFFVVEIVPRAPRDSRAEIEWDECGVQWEVRGRIVGPIRIKGENFRRWSELMSGETGSKGANHHLVQPYRWNSSNLKRPPLIMTNDPICFGLSFFQSAAPILMPSQHFPPVTECCQNFKHRLSCLRSSGPILLQS